jgi:protein TonB
VQAVPAPAAQPVGLPVASLNPATINDYRAQLLGAAGRFKRYPEEARENNWTGDVVVGVAVGANGAAQVGLRRSSGHAVLDRQALEMFQQAARTVPLPQALRGREFRLDVRAVYGLED